MRVQQQPNQNNGAQARSDERRQAAQAQQSQQPARSSSQVSKQRNARKVGIGRILQNILNVIVEIVSIPMHVYVWLVSPQGSQLVFFMLGLLMFALSVESYAVASGLPYRFLVKPFIDDGGDFANFLPALATGAFWVAALASLAVQTIQSWLMRDPELEEAKADYEAVKHHCIDSEVSDREVDEVTRRRNRYKHSGTKTATQKALLLALVYLVIDIPANYKSYPFLSVPTGQAFAYVIYFLLAIFGCEVCINLWRDARRKAKAQNRARSVEVLD